MPRAALGFLLPAFTAAVLIAQTADSPPKFAAADVRVSQRSRNSYLRTAPVHGGRYEVKQATMVDLIHLAYDIDSDKVLGGPSWLEMDRYDVTAKLPADSPPDAVKPMLQSLLAERFKLAIRKETKPLPTYALVTGKKPQLKEADGSEESGCKPQSSGGPSGMRIMVAGMAGGGDGPGTLVIGPGGVVQYACRNMTMTAFVAGLPRMMGASAALGTNPILDETGLKGAWNFDFRWSAFNFFGPAMETQPERISLFDSIEKQLGLKLEPREVPTPVMVVDKVNEKPTDNPPGTSDILPVTPPPTEFEVASVKPAEPTGRGVMMRPMTGGRYTANGMPMRLLLFQAFNAASDTLVGVPAWADTERYDITAKASGDVSPTDRDALAPMLRSLLVERFGLKYHTEDRQLPAYTLTGSKPKMKKADPASRTFCKDKPAPPGSPPATRVLACQNATMAQFAESLQYMSPELNLPVADATGIEGTWDFTLTFSMNFGMPLMRGGGDGGPGAGPAAPPDPNGGMNVFEAVEKELGLKLEKQKRTTPVIVIDHVEQKPTEN